MVKMSNLLIARFSLILLLCIATSVYWTATWHGINMQSAWISVARIGGCFGYFIIIVGTCLYKVHVYILLVQGIIVVNALVFQGIYIYNYIFFIQIIIKNFILYLYIYIYISHI